MCLVTWYIINRFTTFRWNDFNLTLAPSVLPLGRIERNGREQSVRACRSIRANPIDAVLCTGFKSLYDQHELNRPPASEASGRNSLTPASLTRVRKTSDHLCNDPIHDYYQNYFPHFIRIHKIFPSFHSKWSFHRDSVPYFNGYFPTFIKFN